MFHALLFAFLNWYFDSEQNREKNYLIEVTRSEEQSRHLPPGTTPAEQSSTSKPASQRFDNDAVARINQAIQNKIRYPAYSLKNSITGEVVARLEVDGGGYPTRVDILASPHEDLSRAVKQALQSWVFPSGGEKENLTLRFVFSLK